MEELIEDSRVEIDNGIVNDMTEKRLGKSLYFMNYLNKVVL